MRKIVISICVLLIVGLMVIIFMVSKSIKRVPKQSSINEENIINLDLKCEEYNISTDEEFHTYLKTIIKQLEIPDIVVKFVDYKYFRLEGTNFLSFTGYRLLDSILGNAYESILKTIIKNENKTLNKDYPLSSDFIKKYMKN